MTTTDYRTPLTRNEALRLADYDREHHGGGLADHLEQVADGFDGSAVFRLAGPDEATQQLDTTVTLNPDYAWMYADGQAFHTYVAKANGGVPGQIVHRQVPGGFWAVKVQQRGDVWVAFAVPRRDTAGEAFTIATSPNRLAATLAGIGWANSASVAVMRMDRILFVGRSRAVDEDPQNAEVSA